MTRSFSCSVGSQRIFPHRLGLPSNPTDSSIPDRLPYKSIHDIIRETAQSPATQTASEIRKPRLGGMFDTMAPSNSTRS